MRIFVYEFVTGGGLVSRPVPRTLAREGLAMRTALLEDLSAIGGHQIVATTDPRFVRSAPRGVDLVPVNAADGTIGASGTVDEAVRASDGVWLIAPETDRCLERLAARIERCGTMLVGPGSAAVRTAADKRRLAPRLARAGIQHPATSIVEARADARRMAGRIGYPVVVKPSRGAGCQGVRLARHAGEIPSALDEAHRANDTAQLIMQRFVKGQAASVSLVTNGRRAVPLAVNAQCVKVGAALTYCGGFTPLNHPMASEAADLAARTCAAIPGLRGYVGIDMVLTAAGPVVIEVNPRLTMAYLGVRAVIDQNPAELALAACFGRLPAAMKTRRRARFTASGRVVSA